MCAYRNVVETFDKEVWFGLLASLLSVTVTFMVTAYLAEGRGGMVLVSKDLNIVFPNKIFLFFPSARGKDSSNGPDGLRDDVPRVPRQERVHRQDGLAVCHVLPRGRIQQRTEGNGAKLWHIEKCQLINK